MASFLFIYVGAEVTIGCLCISRCHSLTLHRGWIVAFIVKERGGGPSSGYVASGFWGGKLIRSNQQTMLEIAPRLDFGTHRFNLGE